MCLIVFSYKQQPGYRLILAANRDEFLDRPTAPLGLHYPGEQILAGRDLRGGGTWLALGADGRFGAITNYRDPARRLESAPSRGEIILRYLRSSLSAYDFLCDLSTSAGSYEGFNLLLGDSDRLLYFSNITRKVDILQPGLYGLSNHLLDTPWPKVVRIKGLFGEVLAADKPIAQAELFTMLADNHIPDDEQLPDTGVGLEWERRLAPISIQSPGYGTRSSSLLMITGDGKVELTERSFQHMPVFQVEGEKSFHLAGSTFSAGRSGEEMAG